MLDKLMKLKKKGSEMSDVEKDAKMSVMKDLRDRAASSLGEKLKGMKKVSVASDSEAGLKEGLDKAKEIMEGKEDMDEEEMSPAGAEAEGSKADEVLAKCEDMSSDEIEMMISKLEALKEAKQSE